MGEGPELGKRLVHPGAVRMRLPRQHAKTTGQKVKVRKEALMGWDGGASQRAKEKD